MITHAGIIDFLYFAAGSAGVPAECALDCISVGRPVDINAGFDVQADLGRNQRLRLMSNRHNLLLWIDITILAIIMIDKVCHTAVLNAVYILMFTMCPVNSYTPQPPEPNDGHIVILPY